MEVGDADGVPTSEDMLAPGPASTDANDANPAPNEDAPGYAAGTTSEAAETVTSDAIEGPGNETTPQVDGGPNEASEIEPKAVVQHERPEETAAPEDELPAQPEAMAIDRENLGGFIDEALTNVDNGQPSVEGEVEGAGEEALPLALVAEAADEGSIPLAAALSHLPEEGSLPFLEQRLHAGEQPAEDEGENRGALAGETEQGTSSAAEDGKESVTGGEPEDVARSQDEALKEERSKRQAAEAQLEGLRKQLRDAQEQAETEAATRRELEDMMVLIERHFKESQAARRAAEEGLDEARRAMQDYAHKWERLEQENQRLAHAEEAATRVAGVQESVAALEAERAELAAEKEDAEKQLAAVQAENKRLAGMVNKAEEAAKNAEQLARLKADAEHHAVMLKMGAEIERLRVELESRTRTMHVEMEKWRGQAEAAATSIREAKNEVLDRKRELDMTKEKMDALVEKLYIGREIDMELRGAIDYSLQRSHNLRMTDQAAYRALGPPHSTSPPPPPAGGRTQAGPGAAGPAHPNGRKAPPGALQTGGAGTVKLPAISPRSGKAPAEHDKVGGGRSKKGAGEEGGEEGSPGSSGGYARLYDGSSQHKQAVLGRTTGRGKSGDEGKPAASGSPKKGEKGIDRFAETKRIQMMVSHSNRWP